MSAAAWAAVLAAALAAGTAVPPLPAVPHRTAAGRAAAGLVPETGPPGGVRVLVTAAAGVGVLVLVGHLVGTLVGALAAGVAWHLAGRLESPAVRRRRERLRADLPLVVDLMSACLAVGLAPSAALRQVAAALEGPTAQELDGVLARLAFGVDPATAWRDLGGHPQLGALGRCVARSVESGASVADAMNRLADDLRRDTRAEVEARARSVGVRAAVPLGVCLLPAFVLVGVVPLVAGSLPVVLGR